VLPIGRWQVAPLPCSNPAATLKPLSPFVTRMKTSPAAIIMFAVAALVGALGQFLYQSGADRAGSSWRGYLLNGRLWSGVACYIAVMVLFVAAFKKGGALTVLYPVYATTFIWAALLAWFFYGQTIRFPHIAGMLLLLAGMYLMGR
jgi:uncharacterized membrane protein